MSAYPSKQDTDDAFVALRAAREAIENAKHALRTEPYAVDDLNKALQAIAAARQIASIADDYHQGRLNNSPAF